MHTAIVLLALGLSIGVSAGALSDTADDFRLTELAAIRAEHSVSRFVGDCASAGCGSSPLGACARVPLSQPCSIVLDSETTLKACITDQGGVVVDAVIEWSPRVFLGIAPAVATVAADLGAFARSASEALRPCSP